MSNDSDDHFFSPASQFTTAFKGGKDASPGTFIRKRFPSALTSYRYVQLSFTN
jgi:hypothetical protein